MNLYKIIEKCVPVPPLYWICKLREDCKCDASLIIADDRSIVEEKLHNEHPKLTDDEK